MYRDGAKKVKIKIQMTEAEVAQAICNWLSDREVLTGEETSTSGAVTIRVMDDTEYCASADATSRVYIEVERLVD